MYTRHAVLSTEQIAEVIVVAADDAIVGIYFPGHWTRPDSALFGEPVLLGDDPLLSLAAGQLLEYLSGERVEFDFVTKTGGNPFQERVWALLRNIPFGETRTYGDLAEQLGDRALARMVGQAVGHNPLSIVIGCHRVVGKDGRLTGYAGGLARKEFLLALEEPEPARAERLF
jgi:methylated-DNA-[protein]-cysteine S-methyltransferase